MIHWVSATGSGSGSGGGGDDGDKLELLDDRLELLDEQDMYKSLFKINKKNK